MERLEFPGVKGARARVFHSVSWEDDPWARGAYAVIDPSFPISAVGRIFFAGEHTSGKWQGYMNGALVSGRRRGGDHRAVPP